jgi:DNA-binding Lrp family transcriptional regulator
MSSALDDLDRRLLGLLAEDARIPTANLARRLGVARSTVQLRLARLEANGTIAGYTVRLGPAAATSEVPALLSLVIDVRRVDTVIAALADVPEVRTLHSVSGAVDLIAVVRAPSPGALDAVIDRVARVPGVERVQTSIVLRTPLDRDGPRPGSGSTTGPPDPHD